MSNPPYYTEPVKQPYKTLSVLSTGRKTKTKFTTEVASIIHHNKDFYMAEISADENKNEIEAWNLTLKKIQLWIIYSCCLWSPRSDHDT